MKRLVGIFVLFLALSPVFAQTVNKARYTEISLEDYKKSGEVKDREDVENFKLTLKFLLQAANSVAFQDAENNLQRFTSEKQLSFKRGQEVTVYVHSLHSPDGIWAEEVLDLAEIKR
jgi:hypothetical protein